MLTIINGGAAGKAPVREVVYRKANDGCTFNIDGVSVKIESFLAEKMIDNIRTAIREERK